MSRMLCALGALVLTGTAYAQDPAPRPQAGEEIVFDVYRQGDTDFGSHSVRFRDDGGDLIAETSIRLRAGLGPITVFRYEHDNTERWRDGDLVGLSARTLKDGETYEVDASLDGGQLVVDGRYEEGEPFTAEYPASILPSSHWHGYPADTASILNTEFGTEMDVTVEYLGETEIEGDGGMITVDHYRLSSSLVVDLYYDKNGRWAGCTFDARGQSVRYVRRADPLAG
ncbi:MAG: DUF6134 family protein [Oceanicaulis sp.]